MSHINELNKIKKGLSKNTWELLQEYDCMIAGGSITSIHTNAEINDYDVYFRSAESFTQFLHDIYNMDDEELPEEFLFGSGTSLWCCNMTDKSILFIDSKTSAKVQVIICGFYATPQEVFSKFDFSINMGALECKTESFVFHEDFMKHNAQKYLSFNPATLFPLISLLRVKKYTDRGYSISKAQFLRIALKVNELELNSWEDIRNHCGGMYGLDMTEVFKDGEEFSIEKAISILDNLESDSVFDTTQLSEIPFDKIKEKFKDVFKYPEDTRQELENTRLFKNVGYDTVDGYISMYDKKFKYPFGKLINGGTSGIFVYKGYDVVSGIYAEAGHILEILPVPNQSELKEYSSDKKCTIIGDCLVINSWTKAEFKATFKRSKK